MPSDVETIQMMDHKVVLEITLFNHFYYGKGFCPP